MNITDFISKKTRNEKISVLTCYDYPSARIVAETSLDCVLVGDSLAMVVHGYDSTVMATMEMMILHTKAVARGIGKQLLITDLPFLCHRLSQSDTINNVRQLLQAGAQAIKIEGGDFETCQTIALLVSAGIPIIGHIGLTPQSVLKLGGYKVQGKDDEQASSLLLEALRLEKAGCSALVIECVPEQLAKKITDSLKIPTIGIGAGAATDGQVLVWHDMLGIQQDFKPRFVKQYTDSKSMMVSAVNAYINQVGKTEFPAVEHCF